MSYGSLGCLGKTPKWVAHFLGWYSQNAGFQGKPTGKQKSTLGVPPPKKNKFLAVSKETLHPNGSAKNCCTLVCSRSASTKRFPRGMLSSTSLFLVVSKYKLVPRKYIELLGKLDTIRVFLKCVHEECSSWCPNKNTSQKDAIEVLESVMLFQWKGPKSTIGKEIRETKQAKKEGHLLWLKNCLICPQANTMCRPLPTTTKITNTKTTTTTTKTTPTATTTPL